MLYNITVSCYCCTYIICISVACIVSVVYIIILIAGSQLYWRNQRTPLVCDHIFLPIYISCTHSSTAFSDHSRGVVILLCLCAGIVGNYNIVKCLRLLPYDPDVHVGVTNCTRTYITFTMYLHL